MTPRPVVVAFDVLKDDAADRLAVADFLAMYPFDLERMEKAFGGGIVVAATAATHALLDARQAQVIAKRLTGVLAAAIGVKDRACGRLALTQGHIHGSDDDGGLQAGRESPANHAPRTDRSPWQGTRSPSRSPDT